MTFTHDLSGYYFSLSLKTVSSPRVKYSFCLSVGWVAAGLSQKHHLTSRFLIVYRCQICLFPPPPLFETLRMEISGLWNVQTQELVI